MKIKCTCGCAASRAAYVENSFKMIDKASEDKALQTRQTLLFRDIIDKWSDETTKTVPVNLIFDHVTGVIYYPAWLYGMIRIWDADTDKFVYTRPKQNGK